MTFDVINYTYSGLISIFSMIMGMAYPLVNTAITEIDTKYGGNRFSDKVLSEPEYKRLRAILAISIVISILSPFVLYYLRGISTWMYYWELLQTVIARYAARQNDSELYLQCTSEVSGRLLDELQKGKIQSTLSPFYANSYLEECRLTKESKEALGSTHQLYVIKI